MGEKTKIAWCDHTFNPWIGCTMAEYVDWLLLTKRPGRWELIPKDVRPLVWLGISISDQATADIWVPRLLRAEGFAKRFISLEPQIGPVDLGAFLPGDRWFQHEESMEAPLDWVIIGGESGPGARPFNIQWARDGIAQWPEDIRVREMPS